MSTDNPPSLESIDTATYMKDEYQPILWQEDVEEENKSSHERRLKTFAKFGYVALVGLSFLQVSSCYSIGHEENEMEAHISDTLEDELREYRDTADIVTHCRYPEDAFFPPFTYLPIIVNSDETKGWATLSPKSLLPFTETNYMQVVNVAPEKCEYIAENVGRKMQFIEAEEGTYELKYENEPELERYKLIAYGEDLIHVSGDLHDEMQAWHTALHEAAHTGFDISSEACTDTVSAVLLRNKYIDHAIEENIPLELMEEVIRDLVSTKDSFDTDAYINANCDTPVEELMR